MKVAGVTLPFVTGATKKPSWQIILDSAATENRGERRKTLIYQAQGVGLAIRKLIRRNHSSRAKTLAGFRALIADWKKKQEDALAEKGRGEKLADEGEEQKQAIDVKISKAVADFEAAKETHELEMIDLYAKLEEAKSLKKSGNKMKHDAEDKLDEAKIEEQKIRARMFVALNVSKAMETSSIFSFASMTLEQIREYLVWQVFADLDEVPEEEWNELKNAFIDLGLDEHPYFEENNIKLWQNNMSNENAKITVALALGINTSPPPPADECKRLAEEMMGNDVSHEPKAKKAKTTDL